MVTLFNGYIVNDIYNLRFENLTDEEMIKQGINDTEEDGDNKIFQQIVNYMLTIHILTVSLNILRDINMFYRWINLYCMGFNQKFVVILYNTFT